MDHEGDGYHSAPASQASFENLEERMDEENFRLLQNDEFDANRDSDADSAYGNESLVGEDTKTLASFITDYRFEHGRRYHAYKDGAYWGPNDERSNEIQDMAHHMYNLTLNSKLHLAPLDQPHNILDVGTGTGMWAMDMADQYPMAVVTGVDLSPIQPAFVPPNCVFEIDDLTMEWTYPENHFDFIHIREMFGSIPNWDSFFDEVYRCTKPGGWVEVVEHSVEPISDDGTQHPDHFYWAWGKTVVEMGEMNGKSFNIWKEAKERLERAGFVDVTEVVYHWPMNGWPGNPKMKLIGKWNQLRLIHGLEGFMMRLLTSVGQWPEERAQLFLAEMRTSVLDYAVHSYLPGTVVFARKP